MNRCLHRKAILFLQIFKLNRLDLNIVSQLKKAMKQFRFKSKLQFLTYINREVSYSLPKIPTDYQEALERIHNIFQIAIKCIQLASKNKNMCLIINQTSLTHETKILFLREVMSSVMSQYIYIGEQYSQGFATYLIDFPNRLNYSGRMLKAVEEGHFYDAIIIHEQKFRHNGQCVLLQQVIFIFLINEFKANLYFSTINYLPQDLLPDFNNQNFNIFKSKFNQWSVYLQQNNYGKRFTSDAKNYLTGKKQFLQTFLPTKQLTNEQIQEILYFFSWTAKAEQIYLQKIMDNQKWIRNSMEDFQILLEETILKWKRADCDYQQWKILYIKMHRKTQHFLKQSKNANNLSSAEINNSENSFANLQKYLNEIIAEYKIFSTFLHQELAKYNGVSDIEMVL